MDDARFQEGRQAYDAGDFRTAAKQFVASAGPGRDGNGAAYHMAGNSLLRLRRYADALAMYRHALEDEIYTKRGAVLANAATAHSALAEYDSAIKSYESALAEPDYATPYKAFQGIASALLEMKRFDEAAAAFRRAALDESNPNPGAALVNLGLCLMALGRPSDAVDAYQAALGFDTYQARGKALANLGQAYRALGRNAEAVRSFEKAVNLHNHTLSAGAQADYVASQAALAGGQAAEVAAPDSPAASGAEPPAAEPTPLVAEVSEPETPVVEQKDSAWTPMQTLAAPAAAETTAAMPAASDADVVPVVVQHVAAAPIAAEVVASEPITASAPESVEVQQASSAAAVSGVAQAPTDGATEELSAVAADEAPYAGVVDSDEEVLAFLNRTDEEMRQADREMRRAEKVARKDGRKSWKWMLLGGFGLVVLVGALAALFYLGIGWPSQKQTTNGLLTAQKEGKAVTAYWVAVPARDVRKEMAKIPPVAQYAIDSLMTESYFSTAAVTVTPVSGAPLHYLISLQREGVGWKVTGIENDWGSAGGS